MSCNCKPKTKRTWYKYSAAVAIHASNMLSLLWAMCNASKG